MQYIFPLNACQLSQVFWKLLSGGTRNTKQSQWPYRNVVIFAQQPDLVDWMDILFEWQVGLWETIFQTPFKSVTLLCCTKYRVQLVYTVHGSCKIEKNSHLILLSEGEAVQRELFKIQRFKVFILICTKEMFSVVQWNSSFVSTDWMPIIFLQDR